MSEDERKAVEWMEAMGCLGYPHYEEHAKTLKAMLARPVLPTTPSPQAIDAMLSNCWADAAINRKNLTESYHALYAFLARPVDQLEEIRRFGT